MIIWPTAVCKYRNVQKRLLTSAYSKNVFLLIGKRLPPSPWALEIGTRVIQIKNSLMYCVQINYHYSTIASFGWIHQVPIILSILYGPTLKGSRLVRISIERVYRLFTLTIARGCVHSRRSFSLGTLITELGPKSSRTRQRAVTQALNSSH